jgi:hypothetical protein
MPAAASKSSTTSLRSAGGSFCTVRYAERGKRIRIVEIREDGTERPFPMTPMRPMTETEIAAAAAAWIVILVTLGILAFRFAPSEPPVDQVPDREGNLTFHGPDYQLRVPRDQVAVVMSQTVELSVDRREFGSPDAPGPPRIVCTSGGSCIDRCAGTENVPPPPCYDLENGWYRVLVGPISQTWGLREWSTPPRDAGPGFSCGDDGHFGLEYCWDPARYTPSWPVANVHDVPYDAIRQSRIDFAFTELDHWQRLEAGLRGFADRLIVPSTGKNGAATAPNRGTAHSL